MERINQLTGQPDHRVSWAQEQALQQHALAAAFFVLGKEVDSAARVCARQMGDLQLALVLGRLHGAEAPEVMQATLRDELLPYADACEHGWLSCVAHLLLREPTEALQALTRCSASADTGDPTTPLPSGVAPPTNEPAIAPTMAGQ